MATTQTITFTDSTPMPFGKYRGKPMIDVPAVYLMWLFTNRYCDHEGVRNYIIDNLDALRIEAAKAKR